MKAEEENDVQHEKNSKAEEEKRGAKRSKDEWDEFAKRLKSEELMRARTQEKV